MPNLFDALPPDLEPRRASSDLVSHRLFTRPANEAPPEAAAQFIRLMRLKTELRRLRVLGCEATAPQVKLHLREDTPLDPVKLRTLIVKGGGLWRATPDMRLVRVFKEPGGNGLTRAEQMLAELATLGV